MEDDLKQLKMGNDKKTEWKTTKNNSKWKTKQKTE